jgi:crotonobetainyl-CoA:carnitine CoA-transferase CaiB-like acyl-CoA transferase
VQDITDALNGANVCERITKATPLWAALAIAFAGRLAADFGARVVRLRDPDDPLSSLAGHHADDLRRFLDAGKSTGEVETTPSRDGAARVVLRHESDSAGEGDATLKHIVFCGDGGGADAVDTEFTIAARSGLLDIVGRSDSRPLMLGGHQIAYSTGLSGFLALTALLQTADMNRADVSALGTALWINWKSLAAAAQGRPVPRRSAESGKWRTAPCADGHVALVYFDRDWPVLARMTGDPELIAATADKTMLRSADPEWLERRLEDWTRRHTREQIAAASKAFGLAIGPVWTPAELLRDPQYNARAFFLPVRGSEAARPRLPVLAAAHGKTSQRHRPRAANEAPLAGIRVIDLGILTAGASTSAILADLGADVIKVESPTYLDPFRGTPGTSRAEGWWNNSDMFKSTNRNKRGMCLDLKSPRGRDLFLKLAGQSDVVIENFRRGVMRRLGIGYDTLREANGGIILASVSSQGEDGPDANNISFGSTLEATSGLASMTAYEDGVPLVTGMDLNYPDQIGSVFAAATIMAALRQAAQSGQGTHLDISQRELATFLLGEEIIAKSDGADRERLGNASACYLLQDAFATADGSWLALSIGNSAELTAVVELAAPGASAELGLDIDACKQAVRAWIAQQDRRKVCALLRDRGIAAAPVLTGNEAWDYARHGTASIMPIGRSPAGDIVKGFPLHLPQHPLAVTRNAPRLGEHSHAILRDVIGVRPDEIAQLERDGVIGTRPASPNASRLD